MYPMIGFLNLTAHYFQKLILEAVHQLCFNLSGLILVFVAGMLLT